jgi:hypothetical protein
VVWGNSTGGTGQPAGSSVVWGNASRLNQASAVDAHGER